VTDATFLLVITATVFGTSIAAVDNLTGRST
jgi:hypothetical protein